MNVRERVLAGLPLEERRLRLNGIDTAVLEGGEGPPLVLLHGPGEYAAKWLRVVPELARSHRVIAPDLPAHGSSAAPGAPLDVARVLGWLDDLIECTCAQPPVLVGQILGGAIAARFAAERSDRLARLVLCDALGLAAFQPAPEFGAALTAFIAEPNEETHDRLWSRCAYNLDALRAGLGERWESIKAYNLERARAVELKPMQQQLMGLFGLPAIAPALLERIGVPTTLIWGRHDLATPLAVAEAAAARYGWPLHIIEGAADDPPIEQPAAFLKALRSALTGADDARRAWDAIAPGYSRHVTPTHFALGAQALARAGVGAGTRFLDVAAGSGALSIPAARLGAQVLATDLSPAMLAELAAQARAEGLDNIGTRAMDGHALELEDASFDVAGSQFGVMLFPDMPRGIREMARVTRPGGRVLVVAFADPRQVEFIVFFVRAIQSVVPGFKPPFDPPPLPFQLRDPARLRAELAGAGLKDVRVETVSEEMHFADGTELWEWLLNSNPVSRMLLTQVGLTATQTAAVREALERLVAERARESGRAVLTSAVHIATGVK